MEAMLDRCEAWASRRRVDPGALGTRAACIHGDESCEGWIATELDPPPEDPGQCRRAMRALVDAALAVLNQGPRHGEDELLADWCSVILPDTVSRRRLRAKARERGLGTGIRFTVLGSEDMNMGMEASS